MNRESNYLKLLVTLLVTFTCFVIGVFLLVLLLKVLFVPIFNQRWFELLFYLAILSAPFILFEFVHIVFFRRTGNHPSKVIQGLSRCLFVAGMIYCAYVYVKDMIAFFRRENLAITEFGSFDLRFLCINIFGLFLIAIIQAATTAKEVDWTERS